MIQKYGDQLDWFLAVPYFVGFFFYLVKTQKWIWICFLPRGNLSSSCCIIRQAWYVRKTLTVSPSINVFRYVFKWVVYEKDMLIMIYQKNLALEIRFAYQESEFLINNRVNYKCWVNAKNISGKSTTIKKYKHTHT